MGFARGRVLELPGVIIAVHTQGGLVVLGKQSAHIPPYERRFANGKLPHNAYFLGEIGHTYPLKDCVVKDDNFG